MKRIIFLLALVLFSGNLFSQVTRAITVVHCDPADPNPGDNIPWPQSVNPFTWNKLMQMVHYADGKNVKLTLQLTMSWVNMILNDPVKIDTIRAWQMRGHEIAAHHHMFHHTYWDGYSNISSQTVGQNGAVYIDSTEVFYNALRVLCGNAGLLTAGVGPAGSNKDTVAIEWSEGILYRTTNRSGLNPDYNGGRFTDEAFSNVTHDTLYDPQKNRFYEVCTLSYCFLESVDSVNTILSKADTSSFDVVGGVLHPFNYASSPVPFERWIDSIAVKFPGQCKSVRTVIQESACNSLISSIAKKFSVSSLKVYPNPAKEQIFIKVTSEKYQRVSVAIFDAQGKMLKILYDNYMPKGDYLVTASVHCLQSGIYFVKVQTAGKTLETFKFVRE